MPNIPSTIARPRIGHDPTRGGFYDLDTGVPLARDDAQADLDSGRADLVLNGEVTPVPKAQESRPGVRVGFASKGPEMDLSTLIGKVGPILQNRGVPGVPGQMLSKTMMGAALQPGAPSSDPEAEGLAEVDRARGEADRRRLSANIGRAGDTISSAISGAPSQGAYWDKLGSGAGRDVEFAQDKLTATRNLLARREAQQQQAKGLERQINRDTADEAFRRDQLKQQHDEADANRRNARQVASIQHRGAGGVAGGGKVIPAETISTIANYQTGRDALDALGAEFDNKTGFFSGAAQHFPGTDASKYTDTMKSTAQIVGQILEGGKLSESDLPRYLEMMPQPGDGADRKASKIATLKRLLDAKEQNTVSALGSSGYATGGLTQPRLPKVPVSPAPTAGRQEVRDRSGKLLGYINADGSEELVP